MTQILLYACIIITGIVLIVIIIGLTLPPEKTEKRQTIYDASPEEVYNIITNNEDFSYRSDLKNVVVIKRKGDIEVWDEISKTGGNIRFRTALKQPYSRYEFDIIQANGFTGHWVGELEKTETGGTLFTATETIRIKNPLVRVLSYFFFDMGKFMEIYQEDLRKRLEEIK